MNKELKTGQRYNPWNIFVGLFIPNCIARSTKLSQSSKLCLGRLFQYAGKNGKCYPKQKTLAEEIGVSSIKQVQRCLKELEDNKLIKIIKSTGVNKLRHNPDSYIFLWNDEFFNEEDSTEEEEDNDDENHGVDKNVASENDIKSDDKSWDKNVASEADKNVASNERESSLRESSIETKVSNNKFSQERKLTPKELNDGSQETTHSIGTPSDEADVGTEESNPRPKPKHKLRNKKKIKEALKKTKKSHKPPKANEPYWEILENSKFKVPNPASKVYKNTDNLISELRLGKYDYQNNPKYKHLVGRKITVEDFQRFIDNFTLVAFSYEHEPVKREVKQAYQKWYFTWMLMNSKSFSAFATYLNNPPKRIDADQPKDPHPDKTNTLIKLFKKSDLEWDLDNGNRALAIQAVDRLNEFYDKNQRKIQNYDLHYNFFTRKVKDLIEMFEKRDNPEYPVKPVYIKTDLTYNKFLPQHLKDIGVM